MTSRWIWITGLVTTLALGACEQRKARVAEAPPEPAPADKAVAPAEPPPTVEAEPQHSAGAPTDPPAGAGGPVEAGARHAPVDAAAAVPGDGKHRVEGKPGVEDTPSKGDKPSGDDRPVAGGAGGKKGKCGGIAGFRCTGSQKCRYARSAFEPPHPDAMGACVAQTYCDAPADCEGLMHVMVVGKWDCAGNRCAWKAEGGSSAPQ